MNEIWLSWLSKSINKALARHRYKLTSFVYMPEHVHLIVWPRDETYQIEDLLYAIKKPFSDRIKRELAQSGSSLLEEFRVVEGVGKSTFRFWQKGPGHDRNLINKENVIKAAEYIHNNPVRRGLCKSPDAWRWSSWKFYYTPDKWNDSALPNVTGFSP